MTDEKRSTAESRPLDGMVRRLVNKEKMMNIKEMIEAIRDVVGKSDRSIPEADVMAALVNESEMWRMRLQELEDEEDA